MIPALVVISFVLVFSGVPFAFALLAGVVLSTAIFDVSALGNLPLYALSDINDPLLIAIPMLIVAGELLSSVGLVDPIVELADRVIGRFRGSLGLTCVATSLFFAGSTGSSAAEAAAVAGAFRKPMETHGYSRAYVAPLIGASTAVGVLFPPSTMMIIYGSVVQYPVTKLWIAGIFPGILTAVLIAVIAVMLGRRGYAQPGMAGKAPGPGAGSRQAVVPHGRFGPLRSAVRQRSRHVLEVASGALLPVFVVGGIYSGILTLDETASCVVALVVLYAFLISRTSLRQLYGATIRGCQRAGAVFVIIVAARMFSTLLVQEQSVVHLISYIQGLHLNKDVLLLAVNLTLILAGIFMDSLSLVIIAAPILLPLLLPLGISPVHLAIMMALNVEIGVVHPPFGGNIFAVSSVMGIQPGRVAIGILPYVGALLAMLFLITYVPVPGFAWS